uniref:BHLH domain-containing protein n=1 Tax=Kalanchoe fedtschenkoi TaxID=63787 RepID=A0A7N0SZC7_KALFE
MEISVLGQFLRSLCNNSEWKYAVFWKRQYHRNQTMLTWEDGYCDNLKPKKLAENESSNDFFNNAQRLFSSGCGISIHTSNGCPVEQALSDMVYVRYVMGEGVVGKVAYFDTHCWTYCEDILAGQHSVRIPEFSNDWIPQIEAGIKTILLVAVAPYGVLQLGSLEVVTEDNDFLTCIREEFSAIQNCFRIFCSSNSNTVAQSSASVESNLLDNADVSTGVTAMFPKKRPCEDIIDNNAEILTSVTPNMGNVMQRLSIEDLFQESGEDLFASLLDPYIEDVEIPLSSPNDMKGQEWEAYPQHNNSYAGICDDLSSGNINSYIIQEMIENLCGADDVGADHVTTSNTFGIPSTYELCEALGSHSRQQSFVDNWETPILYTGVFNGDTELLVGEASEVYSQNTDVKDLFGPVVASACSGIDTALLNRNDSIKLMSEEAFSSSPVELRFDQSGFFEDESDLRSQVASIGAPRSRVSSSKFSSSTALEPTVGKLIKDHSLNGDMKPSGESKPIHRKTGDKPVDKQKRRPRDRQLIQDRLKVLRNLVPNGEKFSIDGLLDRTIKHMTFLRKVSDQSQTLRAYEEDLYEADGEINLKSSRRVDNWKSGASWAYQAGSEHDVFPIVVEHLHNPGHMLIEMACKEHDLFLEVAQVICGLDLTIVKGGMKTQSDGLKAQFVVEVHNGFQRMDVFWPLMQLLQRKSKPIST